MVTVEAWVTARFTGVSVELTGPGVVGVTVVGGDHCVGGTDGARAVGGVIEHEPAPASRVTVHRVVDPEVTATVPVGGGKAPLKFTE